MELERQDTGGGQPHADATPGVDEQQGAACADERGRPRPLGVVWGRHDPIAAHAMAERLVAVRPGTPLFTMEDVGHYPMVEDPDGFAAAVLRMLDGALAGDA